MIINNNKYVFDKTKTEALYDGHLFDACRIHEFEKVIKTGRVIVLGVIKNISLYSNNESELEELWYLV